MDPAPLRRRSPMHSLSLNIVAGVSEPPIQGLGWTGETPIAAAQDRLVTRAAPSRDAEGLGRAHNRVGK
jgi:hypothetical protein